MGREGEFSGPSAREIAQMLNRQVDSLVKVLFPNAVRAGAYWQVHSLLGEKGDNLKIDGEGRWADYRQDRADPRGKGDMLKLIQLTVAPPLPDQKPQANAIRWAKGWLGIESMDPRALEQMKRRAEAAARRREVEAAQEVDKSRLKARNMWLAGAPIVGTPAMRYLEGRKIDMAEIGRIPRALHFQHNVWNAEYRRPVPAMLTCAVGPDGKHWATHATYLDRRADGSWGKLPDFEAADEETGEIVRVPCAKKIFGKGWLGAHFPINRGASRKPLAEMPAGERVYISEGLEDALTYAMLHPEARVLMAGTLGNIGALEVPPQCGDVVILAQNDPPGSPASERFPEKVAAQQARARAQGSSRKVLCLWPDPAFKDLNDELRGIRL